MGKKGRMAAEFVHTTLPGFRTQTRVRAIGFILALLAISARGEVHCAPDRPWDCRDIALDVRVDLLRREVRAVATLELLATRKATSVTLDAVDLDIESVRIQRGPSPLMPTTFDQTDHALIVALDDPPVRNGEQVRLVIAYVVRDPRKGLRFFAPCEGDPDIPLQMWSQNQCSEARYWIPCFDDPGDLQTTRMRATVPAGFEAVSNGRLVTRTDNADDTATFDWLQDKPHATYLISLVVGKFAVVEETWRGRPLLYYVPPDRRDQVRNAFGRTPMMLDLFSRLTGIEYPWDKYAQVCAEQFNGGMEHTSATTLAPEMLHDDRAHLDSDTDDYISHELAHQWFGNLVTCRTWAHVWLNEGFATLFEALWAREVGGREAYEGYIFSFAEDALADAAGSAVMERDYDNPDRRFDARVYQRGGFVLHALIHRMGEDVFWRAVQRYLRQYRHQPVETHDFRRICEAEYGGSLERFFYDWIERPGFPTLQVSYKWRPEPRQAVLTVRQKGRDEPFHFPFEVAFRTASGESVRRSWDVVTREATFTASLPDEPVMVSIDPDCVVLAEWKIDLPMRMWMEQLRHGPSVSGRIRAARELSRGNTDEAVAALAEALAKEPQWRIGAELAERLAKADTPASRAALVAGLDSRDPRIRAACAAFLGRVTTEPSVESRLRRIVIDGDPSYRVETAAITAWCEHRPQDALTVLTSLLNRPSHQEQVRREVLKRLAELAQPEALELIMQWTRRGNPSECRRTAVQALGRYAQKADPSAEVLKRITNELRGCLEGESERMISATASALADIGKPASDALPALKAVAAGRLMDHTRRAVTRAIESIEGEQAQQQRGTRAKREKRKA